MRPLLVVVLHVAPQNPIQVPGTEDQRPVQTVGAQRLHPALGEGIRVGRPDRCADHANPFACEDVVEGARELGVAVADQDLGDRALVREITDKTRLVEDIGADSMQLIGIVIPDEALMDMKCVGDAVDRMAASLTS